MRKHSSKKPEAVTPDERKQLVAQRQAIIDTEQRAKEAALSHDEAKTEFAHSLLTLRRKYLLKVGDAIDPDTGVITRAE